LNIMKKFLTFLVPLAIATTVFAAENAVDVASLDKTARFPQAKSFLPPVVSEKIEYYEIRGNSEDQLRSEMCRCGCRWKDGKTYDSETSWHVKWDYDYDRGPQACSVNSFRATVDISSRYPKWVRIGDVPQPLEAKWDNYIKSLVAHENGHRDMVVKAATEISRAVSEMPPSPTCAELDRLVQSYCHERLNILDAESKVYDETTSHGILQGAFFP
jgi:predicted secreted Zn-dependent protease